MFCYTLPAYSCLVLYHSCSSKSGQYCRHHPCRYNYNVLLRRGLWALVVQRAEWRHIDEFHKTLLSNNINSFTIQCSSYFSFNEHSHGYWCKVAVRFFLMKPEAYPLNLVSLGCRRLLISVSDLCALCFPLVWLRKIWLDSIWFTSYSVSLFPENNGITSRK